MKRVTTASDPATRPDGTNPDSTTMDVTLVHAGGDLLGEGPHWSPHEGTLHWVDILGQRVHRLDARGEQRESIALDGPVGAVVPRRAGGLLAAIGQSLCAIEGERVETLCRPEGDRPDNRFNDGKCDSQGRFWVGSLSMSGARGAGRLWRLDTEGRIEPMASDLDIANGLGWSRDGRRFYLTDSGRGVIYRHDFDPASGELGERRVFVRVSGDHGVPDGLAVDAEDFVWSAMWDGGCLLRHDPDGRLERRVPMPVPRPTSCAFGGDDRRTLFVTSARVGLSDKALAAAPWSGHLLACRAPVAGLPVDAYGAFDDGGDRS